MSDYPNSETENARMVAYAIEIGIIPAPLRPGERVEILVGGHRSESGRILSVTADYADRGPSISIYLDTGSTLMGFKPSQLRRLP